MFLVIIFSPKKIKDYKRNLPQQNKYLHNKLLQYPLEYPNPYFVGGSIKIPSYLKRINLSNDGIS